MHPLKICKFIYFLFYLLKTPAVGHSPVAGYRVESIILEKRYIHKPMCIQIIIKMINKNKESDL